MLVLKIKPCMPKNKLNKGKSADGSINSHHLFGDKKGRG